MITSSKRFSSTYRWTATGWSSAQVPHLYPLMRLNDQFPRYAALVADTNSARLYVFSLGVRQSARAVQNVKTRHTALGGMSQPRYQRHIENFHLHHAKEVIDVLDRTVRRNRSTR
jgi:hypothetical protein